MAKVIVVTNFSESSRNALEYTCRFLYNTNAPILLLNIFNFPGSITVDAIAVAAMSETIAGDERKLEREYLWAKENFPGIHLQAEMITGVFAEELKEIAKEEETTLIVMGASGDYSDLLSWDTNITNAFVYLDIPVLIIPATAVFKPVHKIAFAVNYYRENLLKPVSFIQRVAAFTKAQLYILHVVSPTEIITEQSQQNKKNLKENLAPLSPVYFEPEFTNIITAIDDFTEQEQIDMLIVIPSRHGIWFNIFQNSHTRQLVYLNHIPIMSVHQEGKFI